MTDPKVRADGKCVVCNKNRRKTRSEHEMKEGYTRLNRRVWAFHVERDPFCSMECCRSYYNQPLPTSPMLSTVYKAFQRACVDCGKEIRSPVAKERCRVCADIHKRKRKYNIPGHCAGCGISHEDKVGTQNCSVCSDRIRRKSKRENVPGFREQERAYDARRRNKRKEMREAA